MDTKRALYKGPHQEIYIPEIAGFTRDQESEGPADLIDELVFHKPDQFAYGKDVTPADVCPVHGADCAIQKFHAAAAAEKAAAEKDAAEKAAAEKKAAAPKKVTGRTATKAGDDGVAVG